ncbi:MAG: GTP 3',8-cyclase MoaA [Methanobrevibacter sp.]|jgi:cyclic pyranopterin phosphate synthase|nr:GTP 3',8-cyclase MoaA [Methanobrevibacter sp.]
MTTIKNKQNSIENNYNQIEGKKNQIEDKYNRPIISLRISLTNRCNLDCLYCHHDGMLPTKLEMSPDEIYQILKIAKSVGIKKIRFSGGEPLMRKDIVEIVKKASSLNFKDIAITTNGILLKKYAKQLKEAGLDRVNVSFDTLNQETYKKITSKDYLKEAKEGILEAAKVGLYPIKINMVVMNGINENEIMDIFQFTKENGLILQLIELLKADSCSDNGFSEKYHFPMEPLEEEFKKQASEIKTRDFMQGRKKYFIDNGEIEVVKPMDNTKFCQKCTRLRITPEGKIKPCLLRNDNLISIIDPIRNKQPEEEVKEIFIKGIFNREPYYTD